MTNNEVRLAASKQPGRILVYVPFSPRFAAEIKKLGLNHSWNSEKKFWAFDASGLQAVLSLVVECFGNISQSENDGRLIITDGAGNQRTYNIPATTDGRGDEVDDFRLERLTTSF